MPGEKFDNGKPAMALLDGYALREVASVLAYGANKYEPHNWRKGIELSRYLSAALRHIFAFLDGEDLDAESGLNHLAHAQCCLMFALWTWKHKPEFDDRWKNEFKHE